jgi:hypothetical protein
MRINEVSVPLHDIQAAEAHECLGSGAVIPRVRGPEELLLEAPPTQHTRRKIPSSIDTGVYACACQVGVCERLRGLHHASGIRAWRVWHQACVTTVRTRQVQGLDQLAVDIAKREATTGCVFMFNNAEISWRSHLQQ